MRKPLLGVWLILGVLYCRSAVAGPDIGCLVEHYNRYVDQHNDFLCVAK